MTAKTGARQMMTSSYREMERENKAQSWKPFIHLITSVKLPWLLILVCMVIQLAQSTLYLMFPSYASEIYSGNFTTSLAITAVLVILGQSLLRAVYQFAATYTCSLNHMRFQNYIWRKLSRLPISFYGKNEPRDFITRITEDTLTISDFLSYSLSGILSTFYTFIGSAVMITSYDWRLGLSQLVTIPLSYAVGVIVGRIYFKLNNRLQTRLADMTRYFSAVLPYITLVKLFGQENREEQAGKICITNNYRAKMDYAVNSVVINIVGSVVTLTQELIVIFLGLYLIHQGAIDIGQWVAFYMYAQMLQGDFQGIISMWQSLKTNQGACARVSAATSEAAEENRGTLNAGKAKGDLVFEDVSFAYGDKNVLNGVSFTAEPGKVTAIVGPSGAGKSTVLNLVERFYTPGKGRITWAGKDARDYELHSWRRNIGYIPQDTQLLAGTIRDNITHGVDGPISREKLEDAARQADILDYIQSLPQGFDAQVGENGAKLSGGQKQRIAIARALLMDSQILVLDEATSNLDAESEYQIQQTLRELSKTHTVLMVAHRMDTVKDADKIVVMENSRVAAQGAHDQLMAASPLYRRLVELQSDTAAV